MDIISVAMAEAPAAAAQQPDPLMSFLPLILIFAVMYFLLIRPQVKRQKEHKKLVDALAKGDEVLTSGGLVGRVVELGDSFLTVEIAEGANAIVQRSAVTTVLPKGTLRDLRGG
ncbi:MAG: preprotein translocase subunit YajC [Halothiobacillaceae bacterium]|jgi:preprotein translocase subunit YajC|nr:MAG: preprotein translocase subunit YajC [Halothiobacillaceae bacterium]